jgi:glutaminase
LACACGRAGVCPLSGDRVFSARTVRNTLSLMASCGMYDYSGEFAFLMGFPCKVRPSSSQACATLTEMRLPWGNATVLVIDIEKGRGAVWRAGQSGVGGSLCIVIPGVTGICTWSPSLDKLGNSVRGQDFCKALVRKYAIHMLDPRSSTQGRPLSLIPAPGDDGDGTSKEAAAAAATTTIAAAAASSESVPAAPTAVRQDYTILWNAAARGHELRVRQLIGRGLSVHCGE